MAITYVSNPLITEGNYPLDARTVTTFDQMPSIEYPFVGMQVYVTEEETTYLINEDCLTTSGRKTVFKEVDELRKNCVKIATADNIIGLLDGITVVGPSGPGIEKRYCLGTENAPKYELTDKTVREPYGWDTMRPTPTELLPFVWSIEAQIIWNSDEQAYTALGPDGWSSPMRENGTSGTSGKDFAILGTYDDLAALKAAVTNPSAGDAYAVGTAAPYDIYIWDALNNEWVNHGAIQGAKGDPGDPAWKSITKFIFRSTAGQSDPLATPPTPTGGSYDFKTGAFNTPNNWQIIDNSLEKPIWMSSKVFAEDTTAETAWDEPIMISGADGSAGEDGVGIEYAYKRAKSEAEAPTDKPGEITEGGSDGNGWWDNPQGVDSTWTCEYVCIRTGRNFEWTEWNEPSLWSKYGANGQDGDGVEYIYYINTLNDAPANPTPNNYATVEDYNKSEWLPNKMGGSYANNGGATISVEDASNWSDNPHGVNKTNKFEYVATRKKVNGTWGAFSEPKLWSTFAEDGTDGTDGETTLLAILDNPMDTVLLDANGNVSTGLPISTNFHVYEGTEELVVENLTYSVPDDSDINGDYITVTVGTSSNPAANFTMKEGSIRNTISTKIPVTLEGTVNVKGKDAVYHTTFLINKISAAAPNIIIDFANDNINIAADEAGVATTLTANNYINAFKGLDELTIESVTCDDSNVTCNYLGNKEVKVTLAKFDTDTYNVLLNVNAKDDEDNVYARSASFRLIKVKAGMPGEPAIFFEIKPNLRVIKTDSDGNIANSSKTLTAAVIKHTGAAIEEFELSNKPNNIIVYYDVDGDALDTIMPDAGLDISNAITGDLDLDRYICLSLYDSNSASVIDKERIYMIHDGTPGKDGQDGKDGADGLPGADGRSIVSTTCQYGISGSESALPYDWFDQVPTLSQGMYLWTKTTWSYDDETSEVGYMKTYIPKDGQDGNDGSNGAPGKDGTGIDSTEIKYATNTNPSVTPTTWYDQVPSLEGGYYLWTRIIWSYTDGSTETSYQKTYIGQDGNDGADGAPGKDGTGIASTEIKYGLSLSENTQPSNWYNDVPTLSQSYYLWTRIVWTYTDDTTETSYQKTYIAKDGQAGVGYKLVASSVVIAKEYNGTVKNTEAAKVSLVRIEGDELINVTSVPEAYELRRYVDGVEEVINSLPDTISTTAMASIEDNVRYELYYVQTGTSNEFIADSVTISVIKDAQPGVDGRMMYFAGEFNINESGESETITYTVDDTTVPYVYDDSGRKVGIEDAPIYFYLATNSYSSTVTPYNDYKAGKDNWRPVTSMDVLYSKIGMFDTANVGPAVFYKDWVFSQNDTNGNSNYKNFTFDETTGKPTGTILPAVWFNFKTGQGSLANGQISWDKSGNVEFGSKVKLSWGSITDAPSIDGSESSVTTAIYVSNGDFTSSSTKYLWTGEEGTYSDGNMYYVWVTESYYDSYMNNEYVDDGNYYDLAFTVKGQDIKIGDNVRVAGSFGYIEGDDYWLSEETDEDISVVNVENGTGNLTATDVTNIIQNTEISGTQIKTGTITSNQLAAGSITANKIAAGSITADKLNVDSLSAKLVNTTPDSTDGAGNITIQGNGITVNEIVNTTTTDYARPVLKIHGNDMLDLSTIPQTVTANYNGPGSLIADGGDVFYRADHAEVRKLGTVTLNGNCDWVLTATPTNSTESITNPYLHYSLSSWSYINTTRVYGNLYVFYDICVVPSGTSASNLTYWENAYVYQIEIDSLTEWSGQSGKVYPDNPYGVPINQGSKGQIFSKRFDDGTYDIYERFSIRQNTGMGQEIDATFDLGSYNYNTMSLTMDFVPSVNVKMTEVAADGLRVSYDTDSYFATNGDSFIMRSGTNAIGLDANGFWIALRQGSGTTLNWSKYSGLSMTGTTGNFTMIFASKSTVADGDLTL